MIIIVLSASLAITAAAAGYMAWRLHRCERALRASRQAHRDAIVQANREDIIRGCRSYQPVGGNLVPIYKLTEMEVQG